MNEKDEVYLKHILEYISLIEESTNGFTRKDLEDDRDILDATLRRIEIIGEATKNLSLNLREKYSNINWKDIVGTRDILIHAYFNVDMGIVWDIVENRLPELKKVVNIILKDLKSKDIKPKEEKKKQDEKL